MSGIPVAPLRPARRALSRPSLLVGGLVSLALAVAAPSLLDWWTGPDSPAAPVRPVDPARLAQAQLEDRSGVRIARVAVIGGGGMIDVRYQVVDPEKALSVHEGTPAVVDERSGRTIDTQWMPHMMPSTFSLGRTYYLLFVNSDGLLQSGAGVTVELGNGRVEHVLVR